ncbi:MAG: FHA domain-containing protein [Lentisphaerae bacterium]|nr:FHA domain-containing protein [Lentisphaerota bacterium]
MSADLTASLRLACRDSLSLEAGDDDFLRRLRKLRQWLARVPPPEAPGYYLLPIRRSGPAPAWVPLTRNRLTVGRSPDSDLCLNSKAVSWHHCVLESGGDAWSLAAPESRPPTNPTLVNGVARSHSAALASGDVVQVGDVSLVLLLVTAAALPGNRRRRAAQGGTSRGNVTSPGASGDGVSGVRDE